MINVTILLITATICINNTFLFSLTHLKNDPETLLNCLIMCYELLKVMSLSKGIGPTINELTESLVCTNKYFLHYNKNGSIIAGPKVLAGLFVVISQSLCCICSAVSGAFKPPQNPVSWRCNPDMFF